MNSQKNKIIFLTTFVLLGFITLQIPLSQIIGSSSNFTLFDSFAPIAGVFLGSIPGAISILLMHLLNFIFHGTTLSDTTTIIKFFSMMFATIYFSRKSMVNFLIPILAIIIFISDPIGRTAWLYSIYWLIPIICYFFQEKYLFAKSLGATFTAHAVGSISYLLLFNLPKTVWISLIPIVAIERFSFAIGIMVSYIFCNNILNSINNKNWISYKLPVNDKKYVIFSNAK